MFKDGKILFLFFRGRVVIWIREVIWKGGMKKISKGIVYVFF